MHKKSFKEESVIIFWNEKYGKNISVTLNYQALFENNVKVLSINSYILYIK